MTDIQQEANKMAQDAGFDIAKHLGKKGIYNIYSCDFDDGKIHNVGFPIFLMENEGNIRFSNPQESKYLLDMLPDIEDE